MDSKNIVEHFGELPDPREDNRRHLPIDIIVIVICASICGAEKWNDIELFGKSKEQWLRGFLSLPHGIASHDQANGKSAIHEVSAWANEAGLTLAQTKVDEKANEITAIPELLEMLELSGCVVSIDAMGTQPDIAEKIIDGGSDYVFALKSNKALHHEQVKLFCDDIETDQEIAQRCDYHKTVAKNHGRIEIRECWATDDLRWLEGRQRSRD